MPTIIIQPKPGSNNKAAQAKHEAKPEAKEGKKAKGPADLSDLYLNSWVELAFCDGSTMHGRITKATRFFYEFVDASGNTFYVPKGSVKYVKKLGKESEQRGVTKP